MVDLIMYFAMGFLVAILIGLVLAPLVHNRAVRLTMRRIEAVTPLSMAEVYAEKDGLRAAFAMSARRLETALEQLKTKSANQLAELSKKTDAINQLKIDLSEKAAIILALEARDKSLGDQEPKRENDQLRSELARTQAGRDRLAHEFEQLQRENEHAHATAQMENAHLRERIADIAAAIAHLAAKLDGPDSAINVIIAANTRLERAAAGPARDVEQSAATESNSDLIDRIRALQSRAAT